MGRVISVLGAIGASALLAAACGDDADVSGSEGRAGEGGGGAGGSGSGGRAGNGGSAPVAGTGGSSTAGTGPTTAPTADAGDAEDAGPGLDGGLVGFDAGDAGGACNTATDCGQLACVTAACVGGLCQFSPLAIGTACGAATVDECTAADTCDGNGVCLPNHQPDGTLCATGNCNPAGVCDCAITRVTTVPHGEQWQTTDDAQNLVVNECQTCDNTLDHIVVFSAPSAGTYRISATSFGAVELGVFDGDCAGALADPECGEVDAESGAVQLDVALDAGSVITIIVGEQCEEEGGEGSLNIELLP